MTTDDLSTPLGQSQPGKRRFVLPFTAPQAIAALLGLCLLVFAGFALFNRDPLGGEPTMQLSYDSSTFSKAPPKAALPASTPDQAPAPPAGQQTVTIIDGASGTRQNVVIGGDTPATSPNPPDTSPASSAVPGINPKLLESSRYGMIPVTADGLKPFRAYATGSEANRALAAKMPSIAIVVAGLGVGAAKTMDAITKLPDAVTLAFTPYGSDPAKLVERARALKHEVLLQLPMEPFNYPDNDPGPQTLLTTLAVDQNLDRMAWHMSRFQGYVGIANFMGSRFLATDAAMQPVIKEAARRGLGWLDDGSNPRSTAAVLAESAAMPFAKADVTIDAVPTSTEIDQALAKLEAIAKERGAAVGIASALPISIERIGTWSRQLDSHGVLLVPLTTAILKPKSG